MLDQISNNVFYCARASKLSSAENYGCIRGQGGVAILWDRGIVGITEVRNIVHDRICVIRLQTDKGGGGGGNIYLLSILTSPGVRGRLRHSPRRSH